LERWKIFVPVENWTPNCLAHSLVTILTRQSQFHTCVRAQTHTQLNAVFALSKDVSNKTLG
jgi:hypothetical protein